MVRISINIWVSIMVSDMFRFFIRVQIEVWG